MQKRMFLILKLNNSEIRSIDWKKIFVTTLSLFLFNSCMMSGMKMGRNMMNDMMGKSTSEVQKINSSQVIDRMIREALNDFNGQQIDIKSIAVWDIRSKTAGLDIEAIRLKLISQIVNLNKYDVISRERLKDLLDEQSLSLSGTIDEHSAVEIGKLIGVQGFIDGYCSIKDNRFVMSLNLIEAKRGVILWAKIVEESL